MSKFFCDSNCELWFDKQEKLGITYISMPYTLDNEEYYYDLGKNTDIDGFFKKMQGGSVPKTSALNKQNYIDYFEPVLAGGEDIFYCTFSHKMSATFNSMYAAIDELKEKYPDRRVTVVDSKHISMGAGIIVYLAATKHNEGMSDEELVSYVEKLRERVMCYFTVAELVYLKRGGRLSSTAAMFGKILDIKPIISTVDGKLESVIKVPGRKKSLRTLVERLDRDEVDTDYPVVVLDAACKPDAEIVKEAVLARYPKSNIWEQSIGPVIGSHCGPETVGLIFIKK